MSLSEGQTLELGEIALFLHQNPELAFEEFKAHDRLTNWLSNQGWDVTREYCELKTAFLASYDTGRPGPTVAFLAEYDALPEMGHACGHNLMAVLALAAGTLARAELSRRGLAGRVLVMGTPAEEGEGGKVELIKRGAFSNVDVALMAHSGNVTLPYTTSLCITSVSVRYHGKPAHAALAPWDGVNALDALVTAYNAISALRQQCRPSDRITGIITEGGLKANIIPAEAAGTWCIRTETAAQLTELTARVSACFEAGAAATGARLEMSWHPRPRLNLAPSRPLAALYEQTLTDLGLPHRSLAECEQMPGMASTDMGNVSQLIPSIHPTFAIASDAFPHTAPFAEASCQPEAISAALICAQALAGTAVTLIASPDLFKAVKLDFATRTEK